MAEKKLTTTERVNLAGAESGKLPQRLFYGDTETTGLTAGAKAIEYAYLELDWNLNILGSMRQQLNPGIPMDPGATKINGKTDEYLRQFPTYEDWIPTIGGPVKEPSLFIAHNVSFDYRFFNGYVLADINRVFCTLELARRLLPKKPPQGPENHKLGTLAEYFGIRFEGEAHEAMADCVVGVKLCQKLLELGNSTLETQTRMGRVRIHLMPWGVHRGKYLHELPASYITWLLGLPDLDGNLRFSLEDIAQSKV